MSRGDANYPRGLRGIEPKVGRWDFDGECVRVMGEDWRTSEIAGCFGAQYTFSLGVFQYEWKARGGFKRGKVVKRFSGWLGKPHKAFEKAEAFCLSKEAEDER